MIAATARARGSDTVIAASFTTTAAAELAGRELPIPKRSVGTLHSLAYRSIDTPPLAEERKGEWNKRHPAYALTVSGKADLDDGAALENWSGATDGDQLLTRMDTFRAQQRPVDLWPNDVRAFAKAWEQWKHDEEVIDFTDMIEIALDVVPYAPGHPEVGFFDEVQDFTPLELALIRKWGGGMERIVLAGDDDQCLYRFKGATPDAFLNPPVDDIDKRVLEQSYRVPAAVHAAAEAWIEQIPSTGPDRRREAKAYLPRDEAGSIEFRPDLNYSEVLTLVDALHEATCDGSTAMVLASCSYMIDPVKHELKRRGLPFHNPFRYKRGDWNPLRPARAGANSSKERLLAYLIIDERLFGEASRLWRGGDIKRWMHVIRTQGTFVRGTKKVVEALTDSDEVPYETIAAMFGEDTAGLERALEPSLDWFEENLLAGAKQGMEFPIKVVREWGGRALVEDPRIIIGTIHSVKGGQADTVFLAPDLSARGSEEWELRHGVEGRDSVIRQMYVGMTRARQRLVLMGSASPQRYVEPGLMLRGAA